ncbi:hypothetical protein NADFUDRAFT_84270, partial [Nadsonia fulvescens var. elongata DSM 6958]
MCNSNVSLNQYASYKTPTTPVVDIPSAVYNSSQTFSSSSASSSSAASDSSSSAIPLTKTDSENAMVVDLTYDGDESMSPVGFKEMYPVDPVTVTSSPAPSPKNSGRISTTAKSQINMSNNAPTNPNLVSISNNPQSNPAGDTQTFNNTDDDIINYMYKYKYNLNSSFIADFQGSTTNVNFLSPLKPLT